MQTYSGGRFYPLAPLAAEVNLCDIAHALSNLCRYTGHVRRFYSVAEHSVLVSEHVPGRFALEALLHDASEAYFADVARPVKEALPELLAIEERIHRAVAERFDLPPTISAEVKAVDFRILADEREALMPRSSAAEWFPAGEPRRLGAAIEGFEPMTAESLFMQRFDRLTKSAA